MINKLDWLWKTKAGVLLAGIIFGFFASQFFYNTQVVTYKDQISGLRRKEDQIAALLAEEKASIADKIKEQKQTVKMNYEERKRILELNYEEKIKAYSFEIKELRLQYDSLMDQYNSLSVSYRDLVKQKDQLKASNRLISSLKSQEKLVLDAINKAHLKVTNLAVKVGKAKQSCDDLRNNRNFYTTLISACHDYESLLEITYSIKEKIKTDKKLLSNIQTRITSLIEKRG